MATKTKDSSSVVGKEKKAPSSNSPITSTKKTTKLTSSTEKPTQSPSEKQVPNYLKPTVSSRPESQTHSFKLSRSTDAPNKPTLNRRRSFDKPPSPSRLPKQQQQPSPSRQHKALVSPGPRVRSLNRSTTLPVKSTNLSIPISKTLKEGKRVQPLIMTKSTKKSSPILSTTSTTEKVAHDDASAKTINVETEQEVKEAIINEENINIGEVEKVENQEHDEVESVISDIPPHHVDSESEQNHDESDQTHIQDDDNEKVIPIVSIEQEEIKDEHEEDHEFNTNKEECNNINESDHKEINHSTTEGEVEVKEKEEGGGVIIEEDRKNKEEEKERVEGGASEGVAESMEGEEVVESEVKEAKVVESITKAKQQVQGKKECHPQVSNDVIEETASKLLMEERKNKVRALAGAFQTVIDYQTK